MSQSHFGLFSGCLVAGSKDPEHSIAPGRPLVGTVLLWDLGGAPEGMDLCQGDKRGDTGVIPSRKFEDLSQGNDVGNVRKGKSGDLFRA